ncbi:MAG: transketolase [Calditrichaeota bacterium]|nr:transketolase [Calditrichota bacterium]
MQQNSTLADEKYEALSRHFDQWEVVKDLIDQLIDLMLNYRQSGHPGGSRSKVHALVATLLSGGMRWDIRHPEKRFGDRFVLIAGHTIPLVYATLTVLGEAMHAKYSRTKNADYRVPDERIVRPEDLLDFRHNGGLPGHAEFAGKTLFLKFNTGPSGHGSPAAAGAALALKMAGMDEVKVIGFEGDAGLTPGANHETMNSAWALGLNNLYYVIDWNNFGIDDHPLKETVYGTPDEWFRPHGWRVVGTEKGSEWEPLTRMITQLYFGENPEKVPNVGWMKTRKGRGYLKYDNKSHGSPHPMNSEIFWETKKPFQEKYGVKFEGFGQPAPETKEAQREQYWKNINVVLDVLRQNSSLVDYIADTLTEIGESVPRESSKFVLKTEKKSPFSDPVLYDYKNYPAEIYLPPGSKVPNRKGLAAWGAWINSYAHKKWGRPLFIAASADLADSTNISGFGKKWGDFEGFGWYHRDKNLLGALLPQEITEFANSGIGAGLVSVNFSENPFEEFDGFYAAFSTYGSFAYLKYGMMRLYSQMAQDCDLKLGKLIWIAGHSGPETADDSRTHFGIFSPEVGELFPKRQIINVHPWEYNEVPVVLGAALKEDVPIVVLHLTRPPIELPDRKALGMASHFEAAKGAYLIRDYKPDQPKMGVVIIRGTSTTNNLVKILPELDKAGLNVKIVAAISNELFDRQSESTRESIISRREWMDTMIITNASLRMMNSWIKNPVTPDYSLSADWDSRWRTGGTVDEICEEAHISSDWILKGIERFAADREKRLSELKSWMPE